MSFTPISLDDFIKKHLERNPTENEQDLRQRLEKSLKDYQNGVKCSCGNDIWVIGSAFFGNNCFSCITNEGSPDNDFEIDSAMLKRENKKGRKHIDEMKHDRIAGFFDDDGYEINMDLIKKPSLCLICVHNNDPNEEFLCNMNRYDQKDSKEFKCFAYKNIK